jgi:uncharacterized alkaline shock family protein YloU
MDMPLKKINDVGDVTIMEKAIEEIAGYAATHCYGVVGMCEKNPTEVVKKIFGADKSLRHGIKVVIKDDEINIDIHIRVNYGVNIKAIGENVKQDIAYAVTNMTNAKVNSINVYVDDIVVVK